MPVQQGDGVAKLNILLEIEQFICPADVKLQQVCLTLQFIATTDYSKYRFFNKFDMVQK